MTSTNVITLHDAPKRVVSFPAEYSLGILTAHSPRFDLFIQDEFVTVRDLALGAAKGNIEVPTNVLLGLKLNSDSVSKIRELAIYNFDVISLDGLNLTARDIEGLLELPSLSSLRMTRMANDENLELVAKLTGLKHLDLSKSQITDVGLAKLANLVNLEELNLSGTAVVGPGLEALHSLKNLTRLDLSQTQITDQALNFATVFEALESLELSHTSITDQGLKHLKSLPSLVRIGMLETKVSPHIMRVRNFQNLRVPEQLEPEMLEGYNGFTGRMFTFLENKYRGRNFVASPLSVFLLLHLLAHAAAGSTKKAFQTALYASCGSLTSAESATSLLRELEAVNDCVKLWIANSIWLSKSFEVNPDFEELARLRYGAAFSNLDSDPSRSKEILNKWTEEQTAGLMKDFFSESDAQSMMLLVNVVYFKGFWQAPFSNALTRPRSFFLSDGTVKDCEFMHAEDHFDYLDCPGFECVSLPYEGNRVQMHFFLPKENLSVGQSIDFLRVNWIRVFAELERKRGKLALPKFKIDLEVELKPVFEYLGLSVLMQPQECCLPGLSPADKDYQLFVQDAKQKAYLKVDEKGTEAAAVTKILMASGGPPREIPDIFHLTFERPFFFLLRDSISGLVLFYGVVENPEK